MYYSREDSILNERIGAIFQRIANGCHVNNMAPVAIWRLSLAIKIIAPLPLLSLSFFLSFKRLGSFCKNGSFHFLLYLNKTSNQRRQKTHSLISAVCSFSIDILASRNTRTTTDICLICSLCFRHCQIFRF